MDLETMQSLFEQQLKASAERERRLEDLLERTLKSVASSASAPSTLSSPTSSSSKNVSVDRPVLINSATLADFEAWEESWHDYAQCQHLSTQTRETRVSALRQAFDEDIRRYLREGTIPLSTTPDTDEIIAAVKKYIRGQRNPLLDRIDFYNRRQQPSESFDNFYTSLKELFKSCDFTEINICPTCNAQMCRACRKLISSVHTEVMRDRIVVGIHDEETRHKLLAAKNLTLEEAILICRAEEGATVTKGSMPVVGKVSATRRKSSYQKMKSGQQATTKQQTGTTQGKCQNCGRAPHTKSACPAAGKKCNGCQGIGHFQAVCRKTKKAESSKVGQLKLCRTSKMGHPTIAVSTLLATEDQAVEIEWMPDTGSDVDAIGVRHLERLGGFAENLDQDNDDVRTANGQQLQAIGKISASLSVGEKEHCSTIHVYDGLEDALLSRTSLQSLGFLPENWPQQISRMSVQPPVTASPDPRRLDDLRESLMKEFADVFDDTELKAMKGPPMNIELQPDAKAHRVYAARPIPFAYRDQVKTQLDNMVAEGIIEPVSEPSEWCHPIVIVDKKGTTEKRLTVDFKSLNSQVQRPTHPTPTPRVALSSIGKAQWFTKIDARHGYWQVPLSESSKPLTTFITPFGRYRYCRNPQGLISAGDEFNRRTDAAFSGLRDLIKIVDDALIFDNDLDEHVDHVRAVLQRAREHGITFSRKKFVFAASEVDFCGHVVNGDGFTVDSSKTAALQNFPLPANRTDLRSFLGLVNQFGDFTPSIAEHCNPLRPLLKQSNAFVWDDVHTAAFEAAKTVLATPPTLSFYHDRQPLRLETDASVLKGLGFALWQRQDEQWRLIQCGSRFLSDAESRYAVIELELLAVVWAVKKCHLFLTGTQFEVHTDHRPLIPIMNSYTLDQVENPRIQRLLLKLRAYQLRAVWRKGTDNVVADALSRNPVWNPSQEDELGETSRTDTSYSIRACLRTDADGQIADLRHHELLTAAKADEDYQAVIQAIQNGFPRRYRQAHLALLPYWNIRTHLSVDNGLILKGQRVVVPAALRAQVLTDLHAAHQGITRTKSRARQVVYWPNITKDIEAVVRSCPACRKSQASLPKEAPMNNRQPTLPFENTSADLCSCQGFDFLIYVDRLTGWPCISRTGRTTSSHNVIVSLRRWFSDVGVPSVLCTDGGPQFASQKFRDFCRRWKIRHIMSSPYYPQSNGHAEAAVKAMKHLLLKTTTNGNMDTDSFQRGLLEWRNTPDESGLSPAQRLFGKPLSSFVLAHRSGFAEEWHLKADQRDRTPRPASSESPTRSTTGHSRLQMGTHVDIQDPRTKMWSTHGVIVAIGNHRDYYVKLPSGRVYWRNRRFLRPYIPSIPPTTTPTLTHVTKPVLDGSSCPQPPRRSQRQKHPVKRLDISTTTGQSYD